MPSAVASSSPENQSTTILVKYRMQNTKPAPVTSRVKTIGRRSNEPAQRHHCQPEAHQPPVGGMAPGPARGQRQEEPGQHQQPDQRADFRAAHAKPRHQRISGRGQGLELQAQAGAVGKQQGQHASAQSAVMGNNGRMHGRDDARKRDAVARANAPK